MLRPEIKQRGAPLPQPAGGGMGGWGVPHLPGYLWLQVHSVSWMPWQTCRYEASCSNQCCNAGASCDKGASKEKGGGLVRWNKTLVFEPTREHRYFRPSGRLGRMGSALRERDGKSPHPPLESHSPINCEAWGPSIGICNGLRLAHWAQNDAIMLKHTSGMSPREPVPHHTRGAISRDRKASPDVLAGFNHRKLQWIALTASTERVVIWRPM